MYIISPYTWRREIVSKVGGEKKLFPCDTEPFTMYIILSSVVNPDPELFPGSGSGIICFGYGSRQKWKKTDK